MGKTTGLSRAQLVKREIRLSTRRYVLQEQAKTRGLLLHFLQLTFWGRLKWLFAGRL